MTTPTHPPPPFHQFPKPYTKRIYTHRPAGRRNPVTGRYEYPHPTQPGVFVSRQRIAQLKAKSEGRCIVCGRPAVTANFCLPHAIAQRERSRRAIEKQSGRPVRPCSCLTTRLEAIAAGKPPPPKKAIDKEARRAAGICTYCGLNPLATSTLCRPCADTFNEHSKRSAYDRRRKRKAPTRESPFDPHAALAAARAKLSS